jgi:hypothetical protein
MPFCTPLIVLMEKKSSQNADSVEQLLKRINTLNTILENSKKTGKLSMEVVQRIDKLAWCALSDKLILK